MRGPLLLLLLLLGALGRAGAEEAPVLREEIRNPAGVYRLASSGEEPSFADRLTLTLSYRTERAVLLEDSLPAKGAVWGDFEVLDRFRRSEGLILWTLAPRRTGEARLAPLVLRLRREGGEEFSLSFRELSFTVGSSLINESGEPEGLLPLPEEDSAGGALLLSALFGALGLAVAGLFLFFRRRRRTEYYPGKQPYHEAFDGLNALENDRDFAALPLKEQYRELYRLMDLLLEEFFSEGGRGRAPLSILRYLNEKSCAQNRWALQALYPLLEKMEAQLFRPSAPPEEGQRELFLKDVRTLRECFEFIRKEVEKTHVPF